MSVRIVLSRMAETRRRFGWGAWLLFLLHTLVNRFVYFEWLELIVLDRRSLRPLPPHHGAGFTARLATADDLAALAAQPQWEIGEDKLRLFEAGDQCVLSLLDGQLAGYTWVHARGLPDLLPGLRLRLPGHVLYNYAGLTAPAFRGAGLQSMRHHSVLAQPQWTDREALVGYVRRINFASRKGQGKSGYRRIGAIWLFGRRGHPFIWLSPGARTFGIRLAEPPTPELPVHPADPATPSEGQLT
jgi:hypothetical protein